ncbi:unnamed protein product [Trichogramma brassicae]|uniref:Reverse transcriptase RNase H-like domain-containing protein n=1 Tax=Trichogramma brassicae TaxID=86971 RepID=A0A6H5I6M5_9HYME|nr:unnamed protein product [Trichogramma brassicae]
MATIVDFPVQHRIVTSGQPVFARPRRLAGDRLAAAKAEFKKLLDRGIIRPSSSQWASPLHLVPKPGNTWRITGDYRLLNARTQPDRHPLPIIEDLLQESVGKGLFGRGSVQGVLPDPGRRRRHLEDGRHDTFRPLRVCSVRGCSSTGRSARSDARGRFRRLPHLRARIRATSSQSRSDRSIPEALRLDTAATLYRHAEIFTADACLALQSSCLPSRIFSEDCRRKRRSLHGALKQTRHSSASSRLWLQRYDQLSTIQASLLLCTPTPRIRLLVPALSQRHADDDWTPLVFFSQKLSPTQQRYSTYDRELLAIFEAIKYFQRILEGRSFTIMTDHRPLSFALEQKSDKFSPRQSRQLDFISRFDAKIVYTPGDENPVADALSRIDAITMPTTLNSAQISAEQQQRTNN